MIASVLTLRREHVQALKIKDRYGVHRAVYSLFPKLPDGSRDFLFVDKGGDREGRRILILSEREPQEPEFGDIECRLVPAGLFEFDRYGFEVVLNPTRRGSSTGKLVPVTDHQELQSWFHSRSEVWGFRADHEALEIRDKGVVTFKKDTGTVVYNSATFVGVLSVVDRALFQRAFVEGMGRAKAFGFGLLQLVPIKVTKVEEERNEFKQMV